MTSANYLEASFRREGRDNIVKPCRSNCSRTSKIAKRVALWAPKRQHLTTKSLPALASSGVSADRKARHSTSQFDPSTAPWAPCRTKSIRGIYRRRFNRSRRWGSVLISPQQDSDYRLRGKSSVNLKRSISFIILSGVDPSPHTRRNLCQRERYPYVPCCRP